MLVARLLCKDPKEKIPIIDKIFYFCGLPVSWSFEFEPQSGEVYLIQHYVIKFVSVLTGRWFSPGTTIFSTKYNWNIIESSIKHPKPNLLHVHVPEFEFEFWCLTPLSAIFQLYHGDQF
jgi:hypothetical protein